jgi:3-dehydroquinate dehydratase/shikimate dehydrogenase
MICVSVGRGRHRMMIAEHAHLAEQGVQLVELRLDYIRRPVNLRRLLNERACPVITTCRRPEDGGKWMRSERDRQMLLRTAVADGADYVDIEMDIADRVPRYGNTQRIISYHNFDETPDNLEDIHHRMCRLDPDIIKIATMANNPIDNIKALRLCRDSEIPTVAFCMGEMGLPSRVLCGRAGAPMTYATFSEDRKMAPGQLSYKEMQEDFLYESITKDTVILGVVADPVAHSLSPCVHNACIREKKLDMLYLPFRVPKEYLEEFIQICPEMGVRGLSVTIPHKERILKCINALDDNVAGIGAANTVVFRDVNSYGFKKDCTAAVESLQAALKEVKTEEESSLADQQVLILGSGGVARAIAFGLMRAGSKVTICGRDHRKSDALATELDCKSIDWTARANHKCNVLINCTPVGMHPNMDETPFDPEWFNKRTIVFDTVYNPEQTLFIKEARTAGCPTITGIDMFVRQAAKQFRLFTGVDANVETIRYEVKRAISAARY